MPFSLITINTSKAVYLVCSESRQQWLADAGCSKSGGQDPDFLLLLICGATEDGRLLLHSDTTLMW